MINRETATSDIDFLSPSLFMEKMTSLCIREYENPDHFFFAAKKAFLKCYENWDDKDQVKVIMNVFRDCFRAYNNSEKQKLGNRFLEFVSGTTLSERVNYNIYESFFMLIRKRPEGKAFVLKAIREDRFMDTINRDFVEEFSNYDFDLYRSLFVQNIEDIADYLYDTTYQYIASTMTDRYTSYDSVFYALMKRKKDKVLILFLKNSNLLCSKDCLNSLIVYAKENENQELLLTGYRCFLMKNSISFKDFYSYYSMLDEEQRALESYFIERVVKTNHFDRPYALLNGDVMDVSVLRSLSLEEFGILAETIKETYPKYYLKYLSLAINKKTEKMETNYDDLFYCLSCYPEDLPVLLTNPNIREISKSGEMARYQYLKLLKDNDMLSSSGIIYYKEDLCF